jgi:hypothetical protein
MMFEVQTMGRAVFVRPSDTTWQFMAGSDGRQWIELTRDQAFYLASALTVTDRFTVTADEEDG